VPPALSAKNVHVGRTQVLNVCHIKQFDRNPAKSHKDEGHESISDTEDWLHWNVTFNYAKHSEAD